MDLKQEQMPRKAAGRGTYAVGDERRARILGAAVEHFARWGFHASSLARIAKEVGITQAGLLHHFRSKEDLLVRVLERFDEQDELKLFIPEPESVKDLLERIVRLARYNAERPGRTRMFNVLAAEAGDPAHPAHAYFAQRYTKVIAQSTRVLRAARERGDIKAGTDCDGVACELAAVMDGLQLQWALAPRTYDMASRLRAFCDRLLRSISTDGSGLDSPV